MKLVHLNDSSTRLTNVFESFSSKSAKFSRERSTGAEPAGVLCYLTECIY